MQGSSHAVRNSPRYLHRKLEKTLSVCGSGSSCGENGNNCNKTEITSSRNTLDHSETDTICDNASIKKPLAMVKPRRIFKSITTTSQDLLPSSPYDHLLRESLSLDPIPVQIRRKFDISKLSSKLTKNNSRSLDAGVVSLISKDLDNEKLKMNEEIIQPEFVNNGNAKYVNNNCNGSINIYDPHCPLLSRQCSLTNPSDDEVILQSKKWRSLETVNFKIHNGGDDDDDDDYGDGNGGRMNSKLNNKKSVGRGSITSWLVNLFQGNGIRTSDVSLRKIGVMPTTNSRNVQGFSDIQLPPKRESIV